MILLAHKLSGAGLGPCEDRGLGSANAVGGALPAECTAGPFRRITLMRSPLVGQDLKNQAWQLVLSQETGAFIRIIP